MAAFIASALLPAWAKDHSLVKVAGKLSMEGKSPADMMLHENGGKSYLYVRLQGGEVMTVDITRPEKPRLVSSLQSATRADRMMFTQNAVVTSTSGPSAAPSQDRMTIFDISKAGSPRIVQEFSGVRRVIEDQRGYMYVLDGQALWVISNISQPSADEKNYAIYN